MEDYYDVDYSTNYGRISSIAWELENLLELLPAAPILRRGAEGALRIYTEIFPTVSTLSDS